MISHEEGEGLGGGITREAANIHSLVITTFQGLFLLHNETRGFLLTAQHCCLFLLRTQSSIIMSYSYHTMYRPHYQKPQLVTKQGNKPHLPTNHLHHGGCFVPPGMASEVA